MNETSLDPEKRLKQLKREVQKRGFERHPSEIASISELPPELRSPALAGLLGGQTLQTIIFFPQQIQRGWNYVPKQALIFTRDQLIHLLGSIWPDQAPQVTTLDLNGLMFIKAKLLLLYGRLEITARGEKMPARIEIEFNALFWDRLFPPLRDLMRAAISAKSSTRKASDLSPEAREELKALPLKFSNGIKIHGVLPGEKMEDLVFQPGTRKRRLLFFHKPVTADTLILLSGNYLVILQEELGVGQGWVVSYLRRDCITGIRSQKEDLWEKITIQLQRGSQAGEYKFLLEGQAARVWRERWMRHGGSWEENPLRIPGSGK